MRTALQFDVNCLRFARNIDAQNRPSFGESVDQRLLSGCDLEMQTVFAYWRNLHQRQKRLQKTIDFTVELAVESKVREWATGDSC